MKRMDHEVFRIDDEVFFIWRGRRVKISADSSDNVVLYDEKYKIYILSYNYDFNYVGLEIFNKKEQKIDDSIFVQPPDDLNLDRDWKEYAPHTLVRAIEQMFLL